MKYIVSENKIFSIIDKIILDKHGSSLKMYNDDEYLYFYPSNREVKKGNNEPFERNSWGRLWINDYDTYKDIKGLLGLNHEEAKEIIRNYFSTKYDIQIKDVSSESDDAWFDDFD